MEPIDPKAFAHALNRVLKRLADAGWVESSAITVEGQMHVQYSEHGTSRMQQLREIIVDELHVALTYEEFHALVALLVRFGEPDTTRRV
jgi:DNA-binding MarR family transcriptional regulator